MRHKKKTNADKISNSFKFTMLVMVSTFILIATGIASGLFGHGELNARWTERGGIGAAANDIKPIGEFRRDLKSFLKRSKSKLESPQRIGAIVDLCLLHDQIVNDPRFGTNERLRGFRAVAADRLKKCRKEIEVELKRVDREARKRAKADGSRSDRRSDSGDNWPSESTGSGPNPTFEIYNRWLVEDMQAITLIAGGPIRVWSYTAGNYGGIGDCGPDLVRLIENTINPDFWRTNGGNGIIYYYQPLRILVISASSQMHDDITGLLRTIRSNGR